jgi:uncharacterized protein
MSIDISISEKEHNLRALLVDLESVVIGYSGGVDSTLLALVAAQELGPRAVAVTAVSPSVPPDDLEDARQIAGRFNFKHVTLMSNEVDDPRYQENTPLRCYWCKHIVYDLLVEYANQNGYAQVVDGSNYDDRQDVRPGRKAALERGVRSPLLETGMTKGDIRSLARELGLPNWDKPAAACLSSRIPYGTLVTPEKLAQVAQAESVLKSFGIRGGRVRSHDQIARLEVAPGDFAAILANREEITDRLQALGFTFVALDLIGYRTGSLNQLVKA